MEYKRLEELCSYLPKSKIKAGEGIVDGIYPFFTSSDVKVLSINDYLFDDELLIIGTGGKPSCNYYKGKFSVSTDNFVLKTKQTLIKPKYLYYFLRKNNLSVLQQGFHGSGLQHIGKDYLNQVNIPMVSLEEQEDIIKNLDDINEIIVKEESNIAYYEELIKSRFN